MFFFIFFTNNIILTPNKKDNINYKQAQKRKLSANKVSKIKKNLGLQLKKITTDQCMFIYFFKLVYLIFYSQKNVVFIIWKKGKEEKIKIK